MPFGQDIYNIGICTPLHKLIIQFALSHVSLVVPGSRSAVAYIRDTYSIAEDRVQFHSWGVDLDRFKPRSMANISGENDDTIRNPKIDTVINIRRFRPAWGCYRALEAFLILARLTTDTHFIILGDADSIEYINHAKQRIDHERLTSRFTIFENGISIDKFADLLATSKIAVSLMDEPDMRSLSILQAIASGAFPVLSNQPEYRLMEDSGLKAEFVEWNADPDLIAKLILRKLNDPELPSLIQQNLSFMRKNEDASKNFDMLIDEITR